MATLTLTVFSSTDDAVINDIGYADSTLVSASAGNIGTPGPATTAANSGQGWRFTGVTLSASDTINSAILKLMKNGTAFSQQNNRWTFANEDNAATFSSGSAPGSRAIVASPITDNNNVNETTGTVYNFPRSGANQTTFGARLASVLARGGWSSGNAVAVINQSKQDASQGTGFNRKVWHDWDSATASSEPQLVIDYTPGVTANLLPLGRVIRPPDSGMRRQWR